MRKIWSKRPQIIFLLLRRSENILKIPGKSNIKKVKRDFKNCLRELEKYKFFCSFNFRESKASLIHKEPGKQRFLIF